MTPARGTAILCVGLLIAQRPYAFAMQAQPAGTSQGQPDKVLTSGQLDSLVAPVALYPDPILSQVLVASTYPLEIVEAARWLKQNGSLQGKALTDAATKQPWDASVQALVVLPAVLNRLNQEVAWTTDLGNAFLAQQEGIMDAVQRMRVKASNSGALKTTAEQTVSTTTEGNQNYIEIEPASTQVVYVPEYNPQAVWGPIDYPYPPVYYPPSTGAVVAAGAISFGVGVAVGAIWNNGGGWGWNCGWGPGRNNVVINNNFINNNHFNRVNVAAGNNWVHNPGHRGGVPYNSRGVSNRFNANRNNVIARPTINQTQQRLNQVGQRGGNTGLPGAAQHGPGQNGLAQRGGNMPGQGSASRIQGGAAPGRGAAAGQGTANRMGDFGQNGNKVGNRNLGGGTPGGGAFGGMNQGGARTRMDSNRGFSSRGAGGFHGGGGARMGGGARTGGGRRR